VLIRALALRTDARPADAAEMRAAIEEAAHATYDWEQDTVLATRDSVAASDANEQIDGMPSDAEPGRPAAHTTERNPILPERALRRTPARRRWALGGITLIGLSLLAILGLRGISIAGGADPITPTSAPRRAEVISTKTATTTASPTITRTPTASPTRSPSPTITSSPTLTPTLTTRPTARPRPKPTNTPVPPTATPEPTAPPTEPPTALPTDPPSATPEPTRRSRPKPTTSPAAPTEQPTDPPSEDPTNEAYPPPSP
jgi:hypothetical protein